MAKKPKPKKKGFVTIGGFRKSTELPSPGFFPLDPNATPVELKASNLIALRDSIANVPDVPLEQWLGRSKGPDLVGVEDQYPRRLAHAGVKR